MSLILGTVHYLSGSPGREKYDRVLNFFRLSLTGFEFFLTPEWRVLNFFQILHHKFLEPFFILKRIKWGKKPNTTEIQFLFITERWVDYFILLHNYFYFLSGYHRLLQILANDSQTVWQTILELNVKEA